MGGGKASAAIGGPIGDAQSDLSNAINEVTYQAFMARGQQNFSGGSQIRSTFLYAVPDNPEYKFTFTATGPLDAINRSLRIPSDGRKIYDPNSNTFFYRNGDGLIVRCDGEGRIVQVITPQQQIAVSGISGPPPKPEPESSPHDAILKPSRKLKFAAE